jgi:hypothetical protein
LDYSLGSSFQLDRVGEAAAQERRGSLEPALDARALCTARDHEMDPRILVVRRESDGGDTDALEIRIGDIVTEERTELLENGHFETLMPVTGTLFFTLHDGTRLRRIGSADACKMQTRAPRVPATRLNQRRARETAERFE